jgi:hypothetical protein
LANCCNNSNVRVSSCCCGDVSRILPTSSMAVAELLNIQEQTITGTNTLVTFSTTEALKNATVSENGITVNNGGTYLINYGINATNTTGSAVSIYVNGTEVPNTRITLEAVGNINGSKLLTLNSGDTISLRSSVISTNIELPANTLNAFVTLVPVYNQ